MYYALSKILCFGNKKKKKNKIKTQHSTQTAKKKAKIKQKKKTYIDKKKANKRQIQKMKKQKKQKANTQNKHFCARIWKTQKEANKS